MGTGDLKHVVLAESGRLVERRGFVAEFDLQTLILRSPQLLGPLGPELTFMPIGWEVPVGPGRLDLLLLDSLGTITLVETKLEANDESRRKVVGQVLEYASYAAEWTVDDVEGFARDFYASKWAPEDLRGCSLSEAMVIRFGWETDDEGERQAKVDGLLAKMDAALQNAELRVVCGVDEHITSLERIVAFLSTHSDLQVVLLQVNRFEIEAGVTVLIPTLHGDTAATVARRGSAASNRLSVQEIVQSFPTEVVRQAVQALVTEAQDAGALFLTGPSGFSIRVRSPIKQEPVTIAWIFAPGKRTWMKTRDITFGHGLDSDQTPPALRKVLDAYCDDLDATGIADDASSKGVRARWISPDQLPTHVDWLRRRMRTLIVELQQLTPP